MVYIDVDCYTGLNRSRTCINSNATRKERAHLTMRSTEFVPFQQDRPPYNHDHSDDEVPDWRLQKPFGAGLKRKRVRFVPASTNTDTSETTILPKSEKTGSQVSTLYLSLVGLGSPHDGGSSSTSASTLAEACPECALPIINVHTHTTSTAHQSSLPHSHPPHPYDRSSLGLKVLTESGWDPDARVGLGRTGEGIRYPIKPVPKDDKLGIGIKPRKVGVPVKVAKKVGVKQARKIEKEKRTRRMKLMGELGGGVDVEGILNAKMV